MDKKLNRSLDATDDNDEEEMADGDEEEDEEEELKDDSAASSEDVEEAKEEFDEFTNLLIQKTSIRTRRTIAEDLNYNLTYVQPFRNKALDAIVNSFEREPIDLEDLSTKDRDYVVERLSLNLPLIIVTHRIESDRYWERKSEQLLGAELRHLDLNDYDNNHKRIFFEHFLKNKITSFVPLNHDFKNLIKFCSLGGSFVKRLCLHQLLIPVELPKMDENFKLTLDESLNFDDISFKEIPNGHLNLGVMGQYFPNLEELEIRYRVENCGLNFEWDMMYCTKWDCLSLCNFITNTPLLKILSINHSRLDDVKLQLLTTNLPRAENLMELSLAYNNIGDDGARFLAKYLITDPPLFLLNLSDNNISLEGGLALFYSLLTNINLVSLELSMNNIGPKIGPMLARALSKNLTLRKLSLAANGLNDEFLGFFSKSIKNYAGVSEIDFSSNPDITIDGATELLSGLQLNENMTFIDLNNGRDFSDIKTCLNYKLESNRIKKYKSVQKVLRKLKNMMKSKRSISKSAFSTISELNTITLE